MQTTPLKFHAAVLAILILAATIRLRGWSEPIGNALGLQQALAARNFLEHGIAATRGAFVLNGGPATPAEFEVYLHHPPLLPLYLAGAFALFGDGPHVLRGALVLLSLGALVAIVALTRRTCGPRGALIAGLAYALCPQAVLDPKQGDLLGEGIMTFMLAGLAARVLLRPRRPRLGWTLEHLGYAASALYDFAGFLSFAIPLIDVIHKKPFVSGLAGALRSLLLGAALAGCVFAWGHALAGSAPFELPGGNIGTNAQRWSILAFFSAVNDWPEYAREHLRRYVAEQARLLTPPLLCALALAFAHAAWSAIRKASRLPHVLCLVLVPPAAYLVLMLNQTVRHHYATILIVPALAVAAGILTETLWASGRLGRIAALIWLLWFAVDAGSIAVRKPPRAPAADLAVVADYLVAHSAPEDLVVSFSPWDANGIKWHARRNVIWRSPDVFERIEQYLGRHPTAHVHALFPVASIDAPGFIVPLVEAERAELRALETRAARYVPPVTIGQYRLYSLPRIP